MKNYKISFSDYGECSQRLMHWACIMQNYNWIQNFKPHRIEFLFDDSTEEDGILSHLMIVNADSNIKADEFIEKMDVFFEIYGEGLELQLYSTINDNKVLKYYQIYVKDSSEYVCYYEDNMSISNRNNIKELMELLKTVYYDCHMEWVLCEVDKDYFEENKKTFFVNHPGTPILCQEQEKFDNKCRVVYDTYLPNIIVGNTVIVGKYFKATLLLKNINKIILMPLENGYKEIIDYAFDGCTNIKSIEIHENINKIGVSVFRNCTGLEEVSLSNIHVMKNMFLNCTQLKTVNFYNDLSTIGDYAFSNCPNLRSITIPNSVTYIGENAFYKCNGLTSIVVQGKTLEKAKNLLQYAGVPSSCTIRVE